MPILLTWFGTAACFSPASGGLAHRPLGSAATHLTIEQRGALLHLAAPEHSWSAEFTLKPHAGKRFISLAAGANYLSAHPSGALRAEAGLDLHAERFMLLDDQAADDLRYLTRHPWSLNSPVEAARAPARPYLASGFTLRLGEKTLPLDDAEIPLPALTRATRESPGEIIFQYGRYFAGRARLYRPLIYLCAFGRQEIFIMLALFLKTLAAFSNYDGALLLLSDRSEAELAAIIPEALRPATRLLRRDHWTIPQFTQARYDLAELGLAGHQPVIYMDVDMLCAAPIQPMLLDVLHQDAICLSSEFIDQPDFWQEQAAFTAWFGRPLFAADPDWQGPAHTQNSGIFGFTAIRQAEAAFQRVTSIIRQYQIHGDERIWSYDQAYASYTLQKLGLAKPRFLNRYVEVLSRQDPSPPGAYPLVHFNHGVGNMAKLEKMAAFYGRLIADPAA